MSINYTYPPLDDRGLILIRGDDKFSFLNGVICSDIEPLKQGRAIWTALLTPQGKYLFDLIIAPVHNMLMVEGEKARLCELLDLLSSLKLHADVEFVRADAFHACAVWRQNGGGEGEDISHENPAFWQGGGGASFVKMQENALVFSDPRLDKNMGARGARLWGDDASIAKIVEKNALVLAPIENYHQWRISNIIPENSEDLKIAKTTLLEAQFDERGAIDWQKGCYLGQELTARMKYRALLKKKIMAIFFETISMNNIPMDDLGGDKILYDEKGKKIGDIRSYCPLLPAKEGGKNKAYIALAELRLDFLENYTQKEKIMMNKTAIKITGIKE